MTKKEFIKQLGQFFSERGFFYKSQHFYKKLTDEVMLVFGLQMTAYGGDYCYMEYGYCFQSISKYLPYPKFYELNLRVGRIMPVCGQMIVFEEVDDDLFNNIKQVVEKEIEDMSKIAKLDRNAFIGHYFSQETNKSWKILGDATAAYFGLSRKDFQYHFVLDD